MQRIISVLALILLGLSVWACSGSGETPGSEPDGETEQQTVAQVEAEPEPQEQAQTSDGPREAAAQAEEPGEESAPQQDEAEPVEETETDEQADSTEVVEGLYDPDAVDLTQLIFWGPLDGYFGLNLRIPDSSQLLIERLLASDSPAIDKYLIDLAAFPNPYREQVMTYLFDRFDTRVSTIFDLPQIFEFDPDDTATTAYLRFKHALFGGQFTDMAEMMDPDAPITIDAREVMWGGVRVDGIPPLEFPRQIYPEEAAAWINDSDVVVGVEIEGDARAYPIRIIAWHEMVNDTIGGVPVSLAYCTLCGSPILFDGRVGGEVYRFGTSGLLYRSNKLMYDRNTRTLWNQFSGRPAWGPLVGQEIRLKVLPVVVTTWGDWLARHPDTTVLSIDTGFVRDYGPGVAYRDYNSSPNTWFNVPISDDRLGAKDNVYVVRVDAALTAYPIELLAQRVLVQDEVGGLGVVVVATADGAGGRSYESDGVRFIAADPEAGTLTDVDGGIWRIQEDSLQGPDGTVLPRVGGHNAFWFAIINQTTNGVLWEG